MGISKLDITSFEKFLGQNCIDSAIETEDRDAFVKRFKEYYREIIKIKTNNSLEISIEHAIQDLMAQPIKELNGKLDLNKQNNYDATVKNSEGAIVTLIECKKLNSQEMISLNNFNKMALHQLIFYYLKESVKENKIVPKVSMKQLIISDGMTWYVWKAVDFFKLLTRNNNSDGSKAINLAKTYIEYQEYKNEETYSKIKDYITQIGVEHFQEKCYVLDLSQVDDIETLEDDRWNVLYHFFSAPVWLGHSAYLDANSLNPKFYHELLHIMGLKEVDMKFDAKKDSEGGKMKIIVPNPDAVNSMYYNLLMKKFRVKPTEEINELAFQVLIIWINRILFLKLFEAHLVNARSNPSGINKVNYAFMSFNPETINSWSDLDYLFFHVLSQEPKNREANLKGTFKHIPYLNSALFMQRSDLVYREDEEDSSGFILDEISTLDNAPLGLYQGEYGSVLAYEGVKEMPLLEYLLKFLSAYSFTTDGKSKVQGIESKLINASVLGNVFEKLNGYKDGSFYTPSFITTYICKESIQQALVARVNAEMQYDFVDYSALKKAYKKMDEDEEEQLHNIIRSLTVLDPAVGSGHFLVSALNELIRIRYDFMMFETIHTKHGFTLSVLNDEIMILNSATKKPLHYTVYDSNTQTFQQELFHTKEKIIENNLFGVDINPNSVEICRLRLWIELLKNSYYIMDEDKELETLDKLKSSREYVSMATLPNIDINIKAGNSLLYNISLEDNQDDNDLLTSNLPDVIKRYSQLHHDYIKTRSPKDRKALDKAIAKMKKEEFPILFGMTKEQKPADIEWRYLFPESLDKESGKFKGFDLVVANPPYMNVTKMNMTSKQGNDKKKLLSQYKSATGKFDLYVLFMELSLKLVRHGVGKVGMILPHKFFQGDFGKGIRQIISEGKSLRKLINFGDLQVFENALTYTCLIFLDRKEHEEILYRGFEEAKTPEEILVKEDFITVQPFTDKAEWYFMVSDKQSLWSKLQAHPVRIQDVANIYSGLPTSADKIYFLKLLEDLGDSYRLYSESLKQEVILEKGLIKPLVKGGNPDKKSKLSRRYRDVVYNLMVLFPYKIENEQAVLMPLDEIQCNYPATYQYIMDNKEVLEAREKGRMAHSQFYAYIYPRNMTKHEQPKILVPYLSAYPEAFLDEKGGIYHNTKVFGIIPLDGVNISLKYFLAFVNSAVCNFHIRITSPVFSGGYYSYTSSFLGSLPIIEPTPEQEAHVVSLVDKIIEAKQAGQDSLPLEQELDAYIFALYGLTDAEIALICPSPNPSKEKE